LQYEAHMPVVDNPRRANEVVVEVLSLALVAQPILVLWWQLLLRPVKAFRVLDVRDAALILTARADDQAPASSAPPAALATVVFVDVLGVAEVAAVALNHQVGPPPLCRFLGTFDLLHHLPPSGFSIARQPGDWAEEGSDISFRGICLALDAECRCSGCGRALIRVVRAPEEPITFDGVVRHVKAETALPWRRELIQVDSARPVGSTEISGKVGSGRSNLHNTKQTEYLPHD